MLSNDRTLVLRARILSRSVVTLTALVLSWGANSNVAWAQCEETAKLLASDGASGDRFGASVAISGDVAVVGARFDSEHGTNSGSAYVYRFNAGTQEWEEEVKLTAPDGQGGDLFGFSVAVSADVVVVGALGDDDAGPQSGSAYVFRYNGSQWLMDQKLNEPDANTDPLQGDAFGYSVAIDGNVIVVGAREIHSAYVYRYDGTNWNGEAELLPWDGNAPWFGLSVAVSDDVVVVGGINNFYGSGSGAAYVFRYIGSMWTQSQVLRAPDGGSLDFFGTSLDVSGNVAVIGAPMEDELATNSGSAYVYRYGGGTWSFRQKLLASDGTIEDRFGHSVAIDGDVVVVGRDEQHLFQAGSANVFRFDGNEWIEASQLVPSDGQPEDKFGYSVALSGDLAVVGAYGDDDLGSTSGSGYIFLCVDGPPGCTSDSDCPDDGNECTDDLCDGNGVCIHLNKLNGAACGNSADTPCDNPDTCLSGTCQANFEPSGTVCPDGLFCNGAETCDGSGTCQPGSDPCPGQMCDEGGAACVECQADSDCDDGDPSTIDTCEDNGTCTHTDELPDSGECTDGCTFAISSFPYTEDWEVGLGDWSNVVGDEFDWTRRSGSTPSSNTGPSGDHTSGSGFYMYTEASNPNYPSKTALLEGPCFDLSGTSEAQLTFWYHMLGSSMGTLSVEVTEDCMNWTTVWSRSGDQGNLWLEAYVDLSAYVGPTLTIRFRGVTGSSFRSDMAIDDISVDVAAADGCFFDSDCNDFNACTTDLCNSGTCSNTPIICDDGDACTADSCSGGTCFFDPINCDDADDCTVDSCSGGTCFFDPISCDDADACTVDSCFGGACFNDPISCDDGDACTDDMCFDGLCENTSPACGLADGCCGPSCDGGSDPDCPTCLPSRSDCTEDAECCSGKCKGGNGKKTCKGN